LARRAPATRLTLLSYRCIVSRFVFRAVFRLVADARCEFIHSSRRPFDIKFALIPFDQLLIHYTGRGYHYAGYQITLVFSSQIDNLGTLGQIDNLDTLGQIDNLDNLGQIDNLGQTYVLSESRSCGDQSTTTSHKKSSELCDSDAGSYGGV
jgi:hypothetical protein